MVRTSAASLEGRWIKSRPIGGEALRNQVQGEGKLSGSGCRMRGSFEEVGAG